MPVPGRGSRPSFWYLALGLTIGGIAGHQLILDDVERAQVAAFADRMLPAVPAGTVYYRYCSDARAAGAAPIHQGEPGYRPELDADGDGVACEPWGWRRRQWSRW